MHYNNPNAFDTSGYKNKTQYTEGKTAAGTDYYYTYGNTLFIVLDTNNYNCATHENVMRKAIKENPDVKWKVVMFHQDIYGSGYDHSDSDGMVLRTQLTPLMDKYDIDVVLQGHDHTYSRTYQLQSDGKNHQEFNNTTTNNGANYARENNCYEIVDWGGDHDLQTVVDTIREAPKAGVNLIDTAPGYNFGNSEKILGKALEGMNREDVKIITKCGVTWDQEMKGDLFNKVNGIQLYKNLNSESVKKEIEASLERLGTDYVDVYMTHWQATPGTEYFVPIQKTMDVLNDLKAQGKIKAIGAANVDINHIQEYIKYGDLDIIQCKYSILDRGIEDEIIPCARENGITIQCYSPLEMGLLSGTFPRDYKPVGAQIPKKWFQPENMQNAMDMMESWKPLCEKYDCTIANLALGWILAQGDFLNLLSGSTTVDEIRENVKSAELELDPEDVAFMRESAEAIDK